MEKICHTYDVNIKNELIIGVFSIFLLICLILFIVIRYPSTSNNPFSNTKKTLSEVAQHNTPEDCWIVIENKIYAISSYLATHPGGEKIILPYCGKGDASQAFATKNKDKPHSKDAHDLLQSFYQGEL